MEVACAVNRTAPPLSLVVLLLLPAVLALQQMLESEGLKKGPIKATLVVVRLTPLNERHAHPEKQLTVSRDSLMCTSSLGHVLIPGGWTRTGSRNCALEICSTRVFFGRP